MKWFVRSTANFIDEIFKTEKEARKRAKEIAKSGKQVNVFSEKQGLSLGRLFSNYDGDKSRDDEV